MITKPNPEDYPVFYQTYVSKLSDFPVLEVLRNGPQNVINLVKDLTEEQAEMGYASGKWSVKQLIGHMLDTEQIMAYRCLCISRGEPQSLPGFDENLYVEHSNFNKHLLGDLLDRYMLQRQFNLMSFQSLDDTMLQRSGMANGNVITANALISIIAGHELHHLGILKERYLPVVKA